MPYDAKSHLPVEHWNSSGSIPAVCNALVQVTNCTIRTIIDPSSGSGLGLPCGKVYTINLCGSSSANGELGSLVWYNLIKHFNDPF